MATPTDDHDDARDPTAGVRARVRTHLANERTFLAWTRTGLTFIALGLGAAQLLDAQAFGGVALNRVFAGLLVVLGGALVLVGRWRYRAAAIAIEQEEYRPRRRGLDIVVAGVMAVVVLAMVLVYRLPG